MSTLIRLKKAQFVENFQVGIELLLPEFAQEWFGDTEREASEEIE